MRLLTALAATLFLVAAQPKITTPDTAAQRLYSAWKKQSRKSARAVAAPETVSKLFSVRYRKLKWDGCERTDVGVFQCTYRDRAKGLMDVSFTVEGGASAGYAVSTVSFSSEE